MKVAWLPLTVFTLWTLRDVQINWPIAHNTNHMCYIKTRAGKVHIITNKCVTDKHIHYIQFSVRGSFSQMYEEKKLTLILLMWRIWWALNNACKWQMGFNLAFKGLNRKIFLLIRVIQMNQLDATMIYWSIRSAQHVSGNILPIIRSVRLRFLQYMVSCCCGGQGDGERQRGT